MSNAIYPQLIGETWPVIKRPRFSTIIQTASSGHEIRIANYPVPLFEFDVPYSVLDMAASDFQTLFGFYLLRTGSFDSFLFQDVTDAAITGQAIGTGNGTITDFQLQRTLGGYTQPVYDINGVIATLGSPVNKIYLNAVLQGSGYTISNAGLLHFTSPPGAGVAITADLNYFWRCRFMDDYYDFENFVQSMFEVKKISLKNIRE